MSVRPNPVSTSPRQMVHSFLLSCFLLMMSGGCKREAGNDQELSGAVEDRSAPLLVLQRTPGYPGPSDPVVSGIVAKLWDNGLLLRSTDPEKPSSTFQLGTVPSEQFAQLLQEIDEIVLTESKDGYSSVTVDAASLEMIIERGKSRLMLAESFPLTPNTLLLRMRDYLFRLELKDVQIINDPDSIE